MWYIILNVVDNETINKFMDLLLFLSNVAGNEEDILLWNIHLSAQVYVSIFTSVEVHMWYMTWSTSMCDMTYAEKSDITFHTVIAILFRVEI